jgi:hypothetical protein
MCWALTWRAGTLPSRVLAMRTPGTPGQPHHADGHLLVDQDPPDLLGAPVAVLAALTTSQVTRHRLARVIE